jgi:hypothetical protein
MPKKKQLPVKHKPNTSGLAMTKPKEEPKPVVVGHFHDSGDAWKKDIDDDMPRFPGEISGSEVKTAGGGLKTVLLRGQPGTGKSRFYLTHLLLAVKEAYKKLTGKDLDWDTYNTWNPAERAMVREAAKHCMMCVIDMDYQGTEDLLERDDIIPPEVAGAIFIMGVSGLDHPDGIRFYEALDVKRNFLKKLEWHSKKYPEYRGQRFLVLDNTGELYRETLNKYFYDTSGGEIKSIGEKMQMDEAENYKRFKKADGDGAPKWAIKGDGEGRVKKAALFQSGRRDTFRVIDGDYRNFFRDILALKPRIGFNFYVTAHVIHYTKEEGEGPAKRKVEKEFADGRADDLLTGFFNLVISFNKVQEYKKSASGQIVGIDVKGWYADTAIGAKNRLGVDIFFDLSGKGAEEFYAELYKRRELDENRFTK